MKVAIGLVGLSLLFAFMSMSTWLIADTRFDDFRAGWLASGALTGTICAAAMGVYFRWGDGTNREAIYDAAKAVVDVYPAPIPLDTVVRLRAAIKAYEDGHYAWIAWIGPNV